VLDDTQPGPVLSSPSSTWGASEAVATMTLV
jgi:hypothetical protein